MTHPDKDQPLETPTLKRVMELASFHGSFDPVKLMPESASADTAPIFDALSSQCVEVEQAGDYAWQLTPDARARVFKRLVRDGSLLDVAKDASRSPFLDELGNMLVRLVVAPLPDPAGMSRTELDRLHIANSLLGSTGIALPSSLIKSELERRDIDHALLQLRSCKLIGRSKELRSITGWLEEPFGEFSMMSVTGVGGIGKSALIADLVIQLRGEDWSGQRVVWIDFDHPAHERFDATAMMDDILRQLALHNGFDGELAQRHRAVLQEFGIDHADTLSPESLSAASTSRTSLWDAYLAEARVHDLDLLIVCDTIEELLSRGIDERMQLIGLLQEMSRAEGVKRIRVICSGRELQPAHEWRFDASLRLDQLSPSQAQELFWRTANLPAQTDIPVSALIDKFGGNPLVVRLLARQALTDRGILEGLLDEQIPSKADSAFIQGFLYTRILGRIRTNLPEVRKLAYPGLALRRVSAVLIREVLTIPCGLGTLDEHASTRLFDELARQFWLVQETSNPLVVLHRKDLRRLMLASIDLEHIAAIRSIHQRAAAFYAEGRDPFMPPAEQALEADYHRLFLGISPERDPQTAYRLLQSVGLDLPCVPIAVRAALKLRGGGELSVEEAKLLRRQDIPVHEAIERERLSRLSADFGSLIQGGTSRLGSMSGIRGLSDVYLDNMPKLSLDSATGLEFTATLARGAGAATVSTLDPAGIHRAFSLCEFDWLNRHAQEISDLTLKHGSHLGMSRDGRALTESPLWQVAIASLVEDTARSFAEYLCASLAAYPRNRFDRWNERGRNSIPFSQAIATVIRLLDPLAEIPGETGFQEEKPQVHITSHDKLRVWQLMEGPTGASDVEIRLDLLTYMDEVFTEEPALRHLHRFNLDTRNWKRRLDDEVRRAYGEIRIASLQRLAKTNKPLTIDTLPGADVIDERVLAGPMTELYPMLRVMLDDFEDDTLHQLCHRMELRCGTLWPRELRLQAFSAGLDKNRERQVIALIEFADRFGRLEQLVMDAEVLYPEKATHRGLPAKVSQVLAAFRKSIERSIKVRFL